MGTLVQKLSQEELREIMELSPLSSTATPEQRDKIIVRDFSEDVSLVFLGKKISESVVSPM